MKYSVIDLQVEDIMWFGIAADQCRHDPDEALFHRRGGAAPSSRLHLSEVHPNRRYRQHREDLPPRHLF